ncbi:MAG: hypothetical protein M3Q16_09200 [Pseudomonadota bacterium]|nr:hypothetical protein [Pseudomonadota bacterium]
MKTGIGKFIAVVLTLGLLASCAQTGALEVQNDNTRKAAQNARTYADHDSLAKRYENTAKELRVKAEEQKKLLQHYDDKSYLYGRQGQDFQSHTLALMRKYEQAAEETITQAAFHHRMASELAKRDYAAPAETPRQRSKRENKARTGSDPKDSTVSTSEAL